MLKAPKVSIIILNWNGWEDTVECLESLYRITYPNYDVIVVDNGSKDDSVQKIKKYAEGKIEVSSKFFEYNPYNKPIEAFEISEDEAKQGKFNRPRYEKFDVDRRMILIKNKDNYGFAGGNNVGIKFALSVLNSDYVLLLNNDTVVDRKFLNELVKVAESDEKIGIVGPKILYYYFNKVQSLGVKLDYLRGLTISLGHMLDPDIAPSMGAIECDYVYGACFLIKSEVILDVGILNEKLFMYGEETEWALRAKENGFIAKTILSAKIYHKDQQSSIKVLAVRFYYTTRNRILLLRMYSPRRYLLSGLFLFSLGRLVWALKIAKRTRNPRVSVYTLNGIIDGLFGKGIL